jgi:hypothetical protein
MLLSQHESSIIHQHNEDGNHNNNNSNDNNYQYSNKSNKNFVTAKGPAAIASPPSISPVANYPPANVSMFLDYSELDSIPRMSVKPPTPPHTSSAMSLAKTSKTKQMTGAKINNGNIKMGGHIHSETQAPLSSEISAHIEQVSSLLFRRIE